MLELIKKSLKKGQTKEKLLALETLSLIVITIGPTIEIYFAAFIPTLEEMILSENEDDIISSVRSLVILLGLN
jgi:hypothetical protein